jgi:phage shock protein PspC (stress-responsive transcriptional regulator)
MKKLYRSKTDRKIAGVMGGLGELLNFDANLLRLAAVLLFLLSGFFPVLITYIVAWVILPDGKPEEMETKTESSASKQTAQKKTSGTKKPTKR